MRSVIITGALGLFLSICGLGCGGSTETITPGGEMTAEQQAAADAEMKAVEDEERAQYQDK